MSKKGTKGKPKGSNADDIKPEEEMFYFARKANALSMKQGNII